MLQKHNSATTTAKEEMQHQHHATFIFNELSKFQRENLLCDVELTSALNANSAGRESVHAHKVVLMSACDDTPRADMLECRMRGSVSSSSLYSLGDDDASSSSTADSWCCDEVFSNSSQVHEAYESSHDSDSTLEQRLTSLNRIRLEGRCCDVLITSDSTGVEYPCHRVVLAACSDYFRAMFMTAKMRESGQERVNIHGVGPELSHVVEFMYTGLVDFRGACDVIQLTAVAVYFQIEPLVQLCVDRMISTMTTEDCCQLVWLGRELSQERLRQGALAFAAANLHQMAHCEVELLTVEEIVGCCEAVSGDLSGDFEVGLTETILRWCSGNMDATASHDDVIKYVRYALIPAADVERLCGGITKTAALEHSAPVHDWCQKALRYHREVFAQSVMQNENTQLRTPSEGFLYVDGVVTQNRVKFHRGHLKSRVSEIVVAADVGDKSCQTKEGEEQEVSYPIRDPFHSVVEMGGFIYVLGGTRNQHSGFR